MAAMAGAAASACRPTARASSVESLYSRRAISDLRKVQPGVLAMTAEQFTIYNSCGFLLRLVPSEVAIANPGCPSTAPVCVPPNPPEPRTRSGPTTAVCTLLHVSRGPQIGAPVVEAITVFVVRL